MLHRVGHWLRAAGHDVVIADDGIDDRDLYEQAAAEQRLLLTRDRKMADRRGADARVILLHSNETLALIAEISERLSIDWLYAPFSRCLDCNRLLVAATEAERHRLPSDHDRPIPLRECRYCRSCDQLFWEGGHVRRMRATLNDFNRGEWRFCP